MVIYAPGSETGVEARKRRALGTGAAIFAVFIACPILAAFTPVLDGTVGGIGVAYLAGFAEMIAAFVVAVLWVRADR